MAKIMCIIWLNCQVIMQCLRRNGGMTSFTLMTMIQRQQKQQIRGLFALQKAEHWTIVQALLSMAQRCFRRAQFNVIRTDNLLPRQSRRHTYHDYGGDRKTDDQGRQTTTEEERPTTTMATATTRTSMLAEHRSTTTATTMTPLHPTWTRTMT